MPAAHHRTDAAKSRVPDPASSAWPDVASVSSAGGGVISIRLPQRQAHAARVHVRRTRHEAGCLRGRLAAVAAAAGG